MAKVGTKLDKIRNLLELAKRSDNISEAESAMKMAQRIALKEGIDLDEVETDISKEERVIRWEIPQETKTAPSWRIRLANVIAKNFKVQAIKNICGFYSSIGIIGLEEDIEVFKVMFDYAETCIEVFFKKYLKEEKKKREITRHDSLVMRNSYVEGFLIGIKEAFEENVECYALSILLPEAVQNELNNIKTRRVHLRGGQVNPEDITSRKRGQEDGKAAGNRNKLED